MACSRLTRFVFLMILLSFVSGSSSRKLLQEQEFKEMAPPQPSLDAKQFLTALPKGSVPASTPSRKGHSTTVDEKLVSRHLAELQRILRSVPSPGVGHQSQSKFCLFHLFLTLLPEFWVAFLDGVLYTAKYNFFQNLQCLVDQDCTRSEVYRPADRPIGEPVYLILLLPMNLYSFIVLTLVFMLITIVSISMNKKILENSDV